MFGDVARRHPVRCLRPGLVGEDADGGEAAVAAIHDIEGDEARRVAG